MSKNKEVGGSDIQATAIKLLEEQLTKTGHLLKNEVRDVIIDITVIEQLVQNISNPVSKG